MNHSYTNHSSEFLFYVEFAAALKTGYFKRFPSCLRHFVALYRGQFPFPTRRRRRRRRVLLWEPSFPTLPIGATARGREKWGERVKRARQREKGRMRESRERERKGSIREVHFYSPSLFDFRRETKWGDFLLSLYHLREGFSLSLSPFRAINPGRRFRICISQCIHSTSPTERQWKEGEGERERSKKKKRSAEGERNTATQPLGGERGFFLGFSPIKVQKWSSFQSEFDFILSS